VGDEERGVGDTSDVSQLCESQRDYTVLHPGPWSGALAVRLFFSLVSFLRAKDCLKHPDEFQSIRR